jgi:hypothetical protein
MSIRKHAENRITPCGATFLNRHRTHVMTAESSVNHPNSGMFARLRNGYEPVEGTAYVRPSASQSYSGTLEFAEFLKG